HASRLYMYVAKCESFGYTIIEAMSAGLPVLTSRAGAVVEILSGGLEECLFDLADSPAAIWARAKEMLAEDGPRRSVIEKQRCILQERHSMQGMIDKTEEFYRELVETRNDRLNHE
ncbi:MAG: glycosyltransferase, partial [Verrucomicrobiia bacterium]